MPLHSPLLALLVVLLAPVAVSAPREPSAQPAYAACWKATFTEQKSGLTRVRYAKGSDQSYTHSYDGPFRWIGQPTVMPVNVVYRYCFASNLDDGGAVFLGDRTVRLARIGSSTHPNGGRSTTGYSDVSMRNLDVFESLYGRFEDGGGRITSLQVELDRQTMVTSVITHATQDRQQTTTYMTGKTVRDSAPR